VPLSKYDIQVDLDHRPGTSHAYMVEMVGSNKRVLDVGCDTGYLGEALQALGNEAAGFEVNEVTAQHARTRMARVEVGDLESSDLVAVFGRGSFDVVIFGDVLEHLRDPLRVLRQARPLLAPGGSVIISTPNIAHGDVRLALLKGRFQYNKVGILDETHTRFFTRDSLVEFLHDAGFSLVELKRTRLDLFQSEMNVHEEDYDPALVATLRADPEALTYQFVVRGVPDDSTQIGSEVALRVDELESQLERERDRVRELSSEREHLLATVGELTAQLSVAAGPTPSWRNQPFPGRAALVRARNAVRRVVR
jgi:2-polyprenyl-3-methyl-5-hydroxy-6-metoxy-1,4-benzoquinol methylase